ncbi:MAG: GAK system XXXCH domain-containing protein [Syntrophobacterales bacterium]|nr:GAK system XXXCH domain-containing protein [Syntrophobacterales bacterium]
MEDTRHFGLDELADYLEGLARQLKSRSLTVAGERFSLSGDLEGKVELWAADGRFGLKLKARWSRGPVPGRPPRPHGPVPRPGIAPPQAPARGFKEIKKRLGRVFGQLKKAAAQGELPPAALVGEFLTLSRDSARFAEPRWEPQMQEFLDHADNLERACAHGHLELFAHELRDLESRMRTCHEEFA